MLKKLIISFSLLFASQALMAQDQFQEGVHYFKIEQPPGLVAPDQVEVIEVFSYGCSHCNTFEPYMQAWNASKPDYVELNRLPVSFGRKAWEIMARGYVTAEVMGIAEETHQAMMDAVWKDKKTFRDVDALADFYSGFGVEKTAFISNYNSFAVDSMMRKAQRDVGLFGISGTPTLIVARKYRVQGNKDVPGFDGMLAVTNFLIEKEYAPAAE